MQQVYVKPGEVHWSTEPCVYKTVLGSCVAVCLWDQRLDIGGLNHFILPTGRGQAGESRFGDVAIPRLISALRALGCADLIAKVFGGAAVLPSGRAATVGDSNTEIAMTLMRSYSIPVVARRTGGLNGVVIRYFSASGDVIVREIPQDRANYRAA